MRLWGLTSGHAGMRAQVQGVLEALGGSPEVTFEMKSARRRAPFSWLPVWAWWGALSQLEAGSDALEPPWPDAVISSGRRSAALALAIRAASGGKTKLIHLTDPRGSRSRFDLIVAMQHDRAAGPNVLHTRFALHALTPEKLALAAEEWRPRFAHLPRPWIAVLVGGTTNKYTLTQARMQALIARLSAFHAQAGGSLIITPSRRTGSENVASLLSLASRDNIYVHDGKGENPYLAMLALADALVVTDDSVNMMSEAAYTGKPFYLINLPDHSGTKPARFATLLAALGIARALPGHGGIARWSYEAPDERARVAVAVRTVLNR